MRNLNREKKIYIASYFAIAAIWVASFVLISFLDSDKSLEMNQQNINSESEILLEISQVRAEYQEESSELILVNDSTQINFKSSELEFRTAAGFKAGQAMATLTAGDEAYIHFYFEESQTGKPYSITVTTSINNNTWYSETVTGVDDGGKVGIWSTTPWLVSQGEILVSGSVDVQNQLLESSEEDNSISNLVRPLVANTKMDLSVQSLELRTEKGWKKGQIVNDPKAGDEVFIHFYSNEGKTGKRYNLSMVVYINEKAHSVYRLENTIDDGDELGSWSSAAWTVPQREVSIVAIIDPASEVDEKDENNNTISFAFNPRQSEEQIDLKALSIELRDSPGYKSGNDIQNIVDGDNVWIHFYASESTSGRRYNLNMNLKINGELLSSYSLDEAYDDGGQPGMWGQVPWVAKSGNYNLQAFIDENSLVTESDESNNSISRSFVVAQKSGSSNNQPTPIPSIITPAPTRDGGGKLVNTPTPTEKPKITTAPTVLPTVSVAPSVEPTKVEISTTPEVSPSPSIVPETNEDGGSEGAPILPIEELDTSGGFAGLENESDQRLLIIMIVFLAIALSVLITTLVRRMKFLHEVKSF